MGNNLEPRFVFPDVGVKVVVVPTIADDKLIVFFPSGVGVLKRADDKLVVLYGLLHYRDRLNSLSANKIILDKKAVVVTALQSAAYSEEVEGSFSVRRSVLSSLMMQGVVTPSA